MNIMASTIIGIVALVAMIVFGVIINTKMNK